jgi:predicted Na+-dependent transporter
VVAGYPELAAVLLAAAIGLSVQAPLAWLAARHGIDVLLAALVFATAVGTDPAALVRLRRSAWPLASALAVGIAVLPALSWAASRLVAAGPLREGVMSAGLAPCEIASVATTAMAGGETALAAGILIGSTLATVALAGPLLGFEASGVTVHTGNIATNLGLVVALPLAAGLVLRSRRPLHPGEERAAALAATCAVAALVALIAGEVHLSTRYLPVVAALGAFLAVSAAVGVALGARKPEPLRSAVLLTTSMRDFAIAAGLAAAAFGPAASAPLGVYGVLVLVWGTAAAGVLRGRHP